MRRTDCMKTVTSASHRGSVMEVDDDGSLETVVRSDPQCDRPGLLEHEEWWQPPFTADRSKHWSSAPIHCLGWILLVPLIHRPDASFGADRKWQRQRLAKLGYGWEEGRERGRRDDSRVHPLVLSFALTTVCSQCSGANLQLLLLLCVVSTHIPMSLPADDA